MVTSICAKRGDNRCVGECASECVGGVLASVLKDVRLC